MRRGLLSETEILETDEEAWPSIDDSAPSEKAVADATRLEELRGHIDAAVAEILAEVPVEIAGRKTPERYRAPELSQLENGLPRLSDGSFFNRQGLHDWGSVFEPPYNVEPAVRQKGRYPIERFPALERLQAFVVAHAPSFPPFQGDLGPLLPITVRLMVEKMVDEHRRRFGEAASSEASRALVIAPWMPPMSMADLPIALVVPIALVRFDVDRFRLGSNLLLVRMSDELQQARWETRAVGANGHDGVVAAATHAFIIKHWSIENRPGLRLYQSLSSRWAQSREPIDRAFAALRLATGVETGYAQEIRLARGWRSHQRAGWPEIFPAGARTYPDHFDDFGWTRDGLPRVTREQLPQVASFYQKLCDTSSSRLELALRRLNTAMVRDDPADGLLDATIGLEVLLGDGKAEAISWKLRMRAAAVIGRTQPEDDVRDMLKAVSEIYDARSKIVHGTAGKSRVDPRAARVQAVDALRRIIAALLDHPEFLDPKRID